MKAIGFDGMKCHTDQIPNAMVLPPRKLIAGLSRTCLIHNNPRHPFDVICVMAWSDIASARGMVASKTPINIRPPAMPNIPERNAVNSIVAARMVINIADIVCFSYWL